MQENKRKCIFAGTFDPPTLGHTYVVDEALKLFDEVVVAILINPQKQPLFSLEQREEMLKLVFDGKKGVRIRTFCGTTDELLAEEGTHLYVRGIRGCVDLDYENANYYASKKIDGEVSAVYLPCPQNLLHVSSSVVRNCLQFDKPIDEFVPKKIQNYIFSVYTKDKK